VIYPVTPNGVEHHWFALLAHQAVQVIYPVTPNGVEHNNVECGITRILSDLSGNA
jgi:hypothetical protein